MTVDLEDVKDALSIWKTSTPKQRSTSLDFAKVLVDNGFEPGQRTEDLAYAIVYRLND